MLIGVDLTQLERLWRRWNLLEMYLLLVLQARRLVQLVDGRGLLELLLEMLICLLRLLLEVLLLLLLVELLYVLDTVLVQLGGDTVLLQLQAGPHLLDRHRAAAVLRRQERRPARPRHPSL